MSDDGDTKDDVKVPEGETGEKIERLFRTEEKDTSEYHLTFMPTLTIWHN
jgi:translation initiation factor 5A